MFFPLYTVTRMVNPTNYVDMELALKDILSVLDLEPMQQNPAKVVLPARSPLGKSFRTEPAWN